jgi:hypothetical protein
MSTRIILDPQLNLSIKGFANAWNASQKHRQAATASFEAQSESQFLDPFLAEAGMIVLETLTLGLLTNAIWDLIKELLFQQGVHKTTTYKEITQPDGTQILIITVEEK